MKGIIPASLAAYGKLTTPLPIIQFQILKIVKSELAFFGIFSMLDRAYRNWEKARKCYLISNSLLEVL
jgi:hypothetical protein